MPHEWGMVRWGNELLPHEENHFYVTKQAKGVGEISRSIS